MIYWYSLHTRRRKLLHGNPGKRAAKPRPVVVDLHHCSDDPVLLPGIRDAPGADLAQPANPYANDDVYPYAYRDTRTADRDGSAADRYHHADRNADVDLYPFANLYPILNPYANRDRYAHAYTDSRTTYPNTADGDANASSDADPYTRADRNVAR
jgi:hypothetical protein